MKIEYYGHSCFLLTAKNGLRFVTDPFTGVGYEMEKVRADYILCSHGHFDHAYFAGVQGAESIFSAAGEWNVDGMKIRGIATYHDDAKGAKRGGNIVYCFEEDNTVFCHMGDIGQPCSAELVSKIGKADLLCVPVGGTYTVDAAGALAYVQALNPKKVFPMHYRTRECTLDIAPLSEFLRLVEEKMQVRCAYSYDTEREDDTKEEIIVLERQYNGR